MVYSAYKGFCPSVEWYDSTESTVEPELDRLLDEAIAETGEE